MSSEQKQVAQLLENSAPEEYLKNAAGNHGLEI